MFDAQAKSDGLRMELSLWGMEKLADLMNLRIKSMYVGSSKVTLPKCCWLLINSY